MVSILNAEVIDVRHHPLGNEVVLLATGRSKRVVKGKARAEASDIILIRNQEEVEVKKVEDMRVPSREDTHIPPSQITLEDGEVETGANRSDIRRLYDSLLRRVGKRTRFRSDDEENGLVPTVFGEGGKRERIGDEDTFIVYIRGQ